MSVATRVIRAWALVGVVALLGNAVVRLGRRGLDTVREGLSAGEWTVLAAVFVLFVYVEGVRALQRKWVPFVVGRMEALGRRSPLLHRLLAPLHVMALVGGPRRTVLRAWAGVAAVIVAILVLRSVPDPWRGIVDVGVAAALGWGLLVLLLQAVATQLEGEAEGDMAS